MTMSYATALAVWRAYGRNRSRKHRRRIDYYPDAEALAAIQARVKATGETWCAAINALVKH